jgi:hypothetical protein
VRRPSRQIERGLGPVLLTALLAGLSLAACSSDTPSSAATASSARTASPSAVASPSPAPAATACVLPGAAGSHVYNPDRLKVLQPCITVTGRIDFIRREADGDRHIGLKLDPQFAGLVNACNATCDKGAEHGDLVIEPVCVTTPTQADAVSSCVGYRNPIVIPPVGSHVSMTGAYVLDLDHGWTELHPLVEVHVAP